MSTLSNVYFLINSNTLGTPLTIFFFQISSKLDEQICEKIVAEVKILLKVIRRETFFSVEYEHKGNYVE